MTRQQLINQLKAIIVDKANPERIWVYGSEAAGEAKPVSDVDIAFMADKAFTGEEIKQAAHTLATLLSFDVVNLAHCEQRFKERVIATGKVIYSNSKQLRAEDALHNFGKALGRLSEAQDFAQEHSEEFGNIVLDLQVKRFEFTYEMSWKAIKRLLAYVGLEATNPRACFKEAFAQGWLKDEALFLEIIEMRNTSAHTYDLDFVGELQTRLPVYLGAFKSLYVEMQKQVDG
ncbi:MAG: HI0074 family nucleotidyltransferase substrate-binding subunit [Marinagarivorans sp.]|nr:HI0074 family nucleotidyltransferase substrate-binding subunit [Marinagarivorans sp.]